MTSEQPSLREFAQRYTAAWCSKDPANVANFFSPNGSLSVNGGAPAVGRSAIAEVARGFMTAFPDLQVLIDDLVFHGDRAFYHWTLTGTNTGPGGTGRRVRISGFEAWEMGTDGLIGRSQGNFDAAAYQRQLEHGFETSLWLRSGWTQVREASHAFRSFCPDKEKSPRKPDCSSCRGQNL